MSLNSVFVVIQTYNPHPGFQMHFEGIAPTTGTATLSHTTVPYSLSRCTFRLAGSGGQPPGNTRIVCKYRT